MSDRALSDGLHQVRHEIRETTKDPARCRMPSLLSRYRLRSVGRCCCDGSRNPFAGRDGRDHDRPEK